MLVFRGVGSIHLGLFLFTHILPFVSPFAQNKSFLLGFCSKSLQNPEVWTLDPKPYTIQPQTPAPTPYILKIRGVPADLFKSTISLTRWPMAECCLSLPSLHVEARRFEIHRLSSMESLRGGKPVLGLGVWL